MLSRGTLRRDAAGVLVLASLPALALAAVAPAAHAATGRVVYSCTAGGDIDVVTDSDLPAKIFVGDSPRPGLTSALTIPRPADVFGAAARSVRGTVTLQTEVDGAARPVTTMTVPTTRMPASGALSVVATGTGEPVPTAAPGDLSLRAGDFSASLQAYDEAGEPTGEPVATTCARPAGSAPVIDTVAVSSRSATSLVLAETTTTYGEALVATATVTTTGGIVDGAVAFVVDGLASSVRVGQDGVATATLPGLRVGDHTVAASYLPKDPAHHLGSTSAPQQASVVEAATATRLAVGGKRTTRATRVTARVKTPFGTTASGKVRVMLRRSGTKVRWFDVGVLETGRMSVRFGRLARGRYVVRAVYRGDGSHRRSAAVKRFRVRRG